VKSFALTSSLFLAASVMGAPSFGIYQKYISNVLIMFNLLWAGCAICGPVIGLEGIRVATRNWVDRAVN
jgi:hypothetical protein